jgi:hypothetical protein
MSTPSTPRVNYLNNRDILDEIHKSKNTFSSYTQPEFHRYDLILNDLSEINIRTVAAAKRNQAKRLTLEEYERRRAASTERTKLSDCEIDYKKIAKTNLVFRIMCFDHIPLNNTRKKNPKTEADRHDKVNFPPFQHWKFDQDENLICVGKSHWQGDLETGNFSKTHGQITDKLARMYMKLCERYSTRSNVRGYTYIDEMRSNAILQLVQVGLQFNEAKSSNPFSYLTAALINAQIRVINTEKRNQVIRDELLEINGLNPSFTRTNNHEFEQYLAHNNINY